MTTHKTDVHAHDPADDLAATKAKLVAAVTAKFPPAPPAFQSGGATVTPDGSRLTPELIEKCCDECLKCATAFAPVGKIDWLALFSQLLPILLEILSKLNPTPKPEPGL